MPQTSTVNGNYVDYIIRGPNGSKETEKEAIRIIQVTDICDLERGKVEVEKYGKILEIFSANGIC